MENFLFWLIEKLTIPRNKIQCIDKFIANYILYFLNCIFMLK